MSQLIINPFRFGVAPAPEFASLYESFNPLTTINKQHVVEWFSGKALDSIWQYNNLLNSPEAGMADDIDGGYKIVTGSNSLDKGSLGNNGIIHYSEIASVMIFNARHVSSGSIQTGIGFNSSTTANPIVGNDLAFIADDTNTTFIQLQTHDRTNTTQVNTDVSSNRTILTNYKVECFSAKVEATIDGILKATSTTDLPIGGMGLMFLLRTRTSVAKEARITYWEALNT